MALCDWALQGFPDFAASGALKPRVEGRLRTQRAQYPLIKEYGLNYIGLHIMI